MSNQPYEIHVKGHLSRDWADWLDNMQMSCLENGEMILSGLLADQAALMGILYKLNSLNLTILSVNAMSPVDSKQVDQPDRYC
jgi:hypothetical protein